MLGTDTQSLGTLIHLVEADLSSNNLTDDALPSGGYVIYDCFGGRVTGSECPVRVVNDEC